MNAGCQHGAECGRCAAELVAEFTGEDFAAASTETSPQYEGIVLARALRNASHRTGMNVSTLAAQIDVGRNALYRRLRGEPISARFAARIYLTLLLALDGKIH